MSHGAIAYIPLLVLGMAVRNVSDFTNVGCFSGEKSNAQMVINLGCSALGVAGFLLAIPLRCCDLDPAAGLSGAGARLFIW